ncbi:MAG: hypothetical protein JXA57_09760 [Armatimonadetes bacterium]|nr:hypothetical protein [Armatimonadota bacterium]
MPRLSIEAEAKILFSLRMHPGIMKAVRAAASAHADTVTGYIEQALRDRLTREGYLPKGKRGN